MTKEISLTNSKTKLIIDDEDYEEVSKYRWRETNFELRNVSFSSQVYF